jgi:hypothetical protein
VWESLADDFCYLFPKMRKGLAKARLEALREIFEKEGFEWDRHRPIFEFYLNPENDVERVFDLAHAFFAIPASNASAERLFSIASYMLPFRRANCTDDTIRMEVLMKKWIQSLFFDLLEFQSLISDLLNINPISIFSFSFYERL